MQSLSCVKNFINLTPHAVTVLGDNNEVLNVIPPSGVVARCVEQIKPMGDVLGVPLFEKGFGAIEGLPEETSEAAYIVSAIVASAAAKAIADVDGWTKLSDYHLFIPNDLVRDDQGRILGCRSFAMI